MSIHSQPIRVPSPPADERQCLDDGLHRCSLCGAVADVLEACSPELLCCGRPMRPLRREEHSGTAKEHEPVLLRTGGGLRVRIGDGSHSRSAAHRIAWIELTCGDLRLRRRLHAGDRPDVVFPVPPGGVTVHALCTRHGLWTSEDADADGRYVLRTGGGRVLRYRRAH